MDRRQKKTRAAIFSAFSELLAEKSFSKITVQDIIDAADVGRTTFYSHFETKDDLLREMCIEIFDHIILSGLKAEKSHDFSISEGSPHDILTHLLFHIRDNKKIIVGIMSGESAELFLNYFRRQLSEILAGWISDSSESGNVPRDFVINHISGSFTTMLRWWIDHKMEESPEQLSSYFLIVNKGLIPSNDH